MKTKTEYPKEKLARGEILSGNPCNISNLRVPDIVTAAD